jgi:hypothetical protein
MIEQTVIEIARQRFWAWQRRHAPTPRNQLRETDALLGLVEECRLRRLPLIPTPLWRRVVQLLGQIDAAAGNRLGIDRSVERASEVLFRAQEQLMAKAAAARRPHPGRVVPLFRHPAG